jgi:predicted enzyme related to lactoylglutathione lyase
MLSMLVNLDVDDLERAVEFYVQGLGLEIGRRLGADVVELLGASSPIYLLRKRAGTAGCPGKPRDYARHWTPVHLDFVVPSLAPALARALAAGAALERGTETAVWGRIAGLADPFGHGFCLIEFLNRGYDELT